MTPARPECSLHACDDLVDREKVRGSQHRTPTMQRPIVTSDHSLPPGVLNSRRT